MSARQLLNFCYAVMFDLAVAGGNKELGEWLQSLHIKQQVDDGLTPESLVGEYAPAWFGDD